LGGKQAQEKGEEVNKTNLGVRKGEARYTFLVLFRSWRTRANYRRSFMLINKKRKDLAHSLCHIVWYNVRVRWDYCLIFIFLKTLFNYKMATFGIGIEPCVVAICVCITEIALLKTVLSSLYVCIFYVFHTKNKYERLQREKMPDVVIFVMISSIITGTC
jgi:hypothetical protein